MEPNILACSWEQTIRGNIKTWQLAISDSLCDYLHRTVKMCTDRRKSTIVYVGSNDYKNNIRYVIWVNGNAPAIANSNKNPIPIT